MSFGKKMVRDAPLYLQGVRKKSHPNIRLKKTRKKKCKQILEIMHPYECTCIYRPFSYCIDYVIGIESEARHYEHLTTGRSRLPDFLPKLYPPVLKCANVLPRFRFRSHNQ